MGGGGLVGAVGGLVGIDSAETSAANSASANALATSQASLDRTTALGEDMMGFNQGILDDWEGMFGGLEQNLNDYYTNLDPAKYATQSKTNLYENIDKQMSQLNESLSAQGIQTSGMRAQAEKEAAFGKATGAAEIDIAAEDYVRGQQGAWLGANKQDQANARSAVNNSYGTQINADLAASGAVSQGYNNQAAQYSASAAGWTNLLGQAAGAGASAMTGGATGFSGMSNQQSADYGAYMGLQG